MNDDIEVIDLENENNNTENHLKKKKNPLKIIIIILSSILILFLISYVLLLVKFNFNIKYDEVILENGSTYQLELDSMFKDNFNNKNYLFEIKDSNVATVNEEGFITSKSNGTTEIKIKYKYSLFSKTIKLSVQDINISNIKLEDISIKTDESIRLNPIINNKENLKVNLIYESENTDIAKVDSFGNVTSVSPGETKIRIKGKNNITKEINVTVESTSIEVSNISLTETSIPLRKANKVKLIPIIEPIDATDTKLKWTSDTGNAVVDDTGTVLANQFGVSNITVETSNGKKATCTIMVLNTNIQVTNITLNENKKEMKVGETFQLIPTITPDTTTIRDITWSSSNEKVASVNNGKVLAKKKGNATITASSTNNKTDSCTISIKDKEIMAEKISLSIDNTILKVGDSLILRPTISPDNTVNKKVKWSSSDNSIASVKNGVVTAKKEGTVVITSKTANGKTSHSIIIVKR